MAGSVLKYGVCGLIFRDGMRKDDWIKLYVPFIIGLLVGGGAGYTNINMTAYFIITPIILSVLMFVCIRYFSEPEIDERLEFEKRNRKRDEAKEKNQIFVEFLQYLNEDYINELIVAYGGSQPYGVTRLMSLISKNIQNGILSTYIDEDKRLIDDLRNMQKACVDYILILSYKERHSPTLAYEILKLVQPIKEKIAKKLSDPLVEYGSHEREEGS